MNDKRHSEANIQDVIPKIRESLQKNTVIIEEVNTKDYFKEKKRTLKKGLFMSGIVDSGKTHTLHAIKKVVSTWGNSSKVYNFLELLNDMKKNSLKDYYRILEDLHEKDFIFIDELGIEKDTENVQEILYLIVDRAYRKETPLFLATNLSLESFLERYGERIFRRIKESCEIFELKNKHA